ncbi:TetR/AcrR family transcriptional regulator [Actinomadura rudentiformis]|uniref:TetR/AcrR family transcriptional regulator n=1 Tax=Actinomadura rudentiformis TaxID=359158 RepID=A0A6H9YKQ7_9ACTN|nr:TetR/AcrR family transcriptional regulator [Actinomadura rudentiformis]
MMRAGARLFATEGIDAARTRDIVALAGQGNDSAITYHFGSRRGLLEAILRAGVDRMEPARAEALATLDPTDLRAVVEAIVEPIAEELKTEDGRDFLRIVVQVAGHAGVRSHTVPALIQDTAIARQLHMLEDACRAFLPEPLALERIAVVIAFLTAALADRTARDDSLLDHDTFVADLVEMLTAALRAPAISSRSPSGPYRVNASPRGGAVR